MRNWCAGESCIMFTHSLQWCDSDIFNDSPQPDRSHRRASSVNGLEVLISAGSLVLGRSDYHPFLSFGRWRWWPLQKDKQQHSRPLFGVVKLFLMI